MCAMCEFILMDTFCFHTHCIYYRLYMFKVHILMDFFVAINSIHIDQKKIRNGGHTHRIVYLTAVSSDKKRCTNNFRMCIAAKHIYIVRSCLYILQTHRREIATMIHLSAFRCSHFVNVYVSERSYCLKHQSHGFYVVQMDTPTILIKQAQFKSMVQRMLTANIPLCYLFDKKRTYFVQTYYIQDKVLFKIN